MKEKEAKALKRSKELKKEMKEDWWFFNCKFCPKAINEKKKVFTIKRKENEPYERLLEKLEGHFYDDHHHHYIEQFVRTIN